MDEVSVQSVSLQMTSCLQSITTQDDKTSPFGGAKDDKSADAGKVTEEVKIANYPQGNHSQGQVSTSTQEHPASRIDTSHPTDQKPTMSQEQVGDQVRTAEHHQVNASIVQHTLLLHHDHNCIL